MEFSIKDRFDATVSYVGMVATRFSASCIITGDGGLGKTYTVMQTLSMYNMTPIAPFTTGTNYFVHVKGYSTAKGLYELLYRHRNDIIVFDDCDSILEDKTAVNLLKSALDSYDKRTITWNTSTRLSDTVPKSFEFRGGVIFISNKTMNTIPQALLTRALTVDLFMTQDEKIERLTDLVNTGKFMPQYTKQVLNESLELIIEHKNEIKNLSIRSLINVVKLRYAIPNNWKIKALYSLI